MAVSLKLCSSVPVISNAGGEYFNIPFHTASLISLIIDPIDLSSIDPFHGSLIRGKFKVHLQTRGDY